MTDRTGYDSDTITDIPRSALLINAYVDGPSNIEAARAEFPRAVIGSISTHGEKPATTYDVETGLLTVPAGVQLAHNQIETGTPATIYCNLSTWPAVKAEVARYKWRVKPDYWIAHYTGIAHRIKGTIATQYAAPPDTPGHYDLSLCAPYWPGVDPTPPTPLSPLHRRYVAALNKAWGPDGRTQPLADRDVDAVKLLEQRAGRILEL
jgi:hypothetical protein